MKTRVIIGLVAVLASAVSCRKQDIRTAAIFVPGMRTEACAQRIVVALGRGQNVNPEAIEIDLATRTVRVQYDSIKHSLKNLEFTVAEAGFDANGVPADEEVRRALPAECR